MQPILLALRKALRKSIVIVCLMSLISMSGVFIFQQPSYAAIASNSKVNKQEYKIGNTNPNSQDTNREEAYEHAAEEAQKLDNMESVYEENLDEYKEENPGPGLLEKAEEVIEKVTGKE